MTRRGQIHTDEELAELLRPERLDLPGRPRVVEMKVRGIEDSAGEDALDIYVILDDSTRKKDWTWKTLRPIYDAIQQTLERAGETRFPYITAGTREHYNRRYTYDPESDE